MNKKILNIAIRKFQKLSENYNGFINVVVDNWRGWRFIFDTSDVRKCKNQCQKCPLYLLVKNERKRVFSTGLYPASKKDKKLFGPQKFLNCKTLKQYENCFINFILIKTKNKKGVEKELMLLKNFRIIFSKEKTNLPEKEKEFRKSVIRNLLKKAKIAQKAIIIRVVQQKKIL